MGEEEVVGVCMGRGVEMVEVLLGILKAGGAYLPLDPAYPKERLAFMLEDAGVNVVITHKETKGRLPQHNAKELCLDEDWYLISAQSRDNLNLSLLPDSLAYVIYTSGSTGKPKGVMISHSNVLRLFAATEQWYGFNENDVWTMFHSFGFDFSVWELWGALIYGGRVVVVPYWVSRSTQAFYEMLKSEKVTVLNQTPSAFRQLMLAEERDESGDALSLREVIFGGEALELGSLRPWVRRHRGGRPRLVNMYGITETTVHVTYRPLTEDEIEGGMGSVIGRPIEDLTVYVLDDQMRLMPVGIPGEMYVGGDGLSRGYLNRPALTAERFVPNPFSKEAGARLYKTGDLARYKSGGDLEYLGRIDEQVKVRGYRIELGEIEAAIVQHPAIREAVVIAREDVPGDKRLAAYLVQDPGYRPSQEELADGEGEDEQVLQWQAVFDETYTQPADNRDSMLNIVGWNSSYTRQPIPAEEMSEWVNHTVERILSYKPTRVLEIGCGTGLLLLRIAPHCDQYHATDFSQEALRCIEQHLSESGKDLPHLTLSRRMADNFEGIRDATFDAVILNSVAQYFPGIDYLAQVIEGAAKAVAPGGFIFVGDIRSLPLLEAFHASVQVYQAAPALPTAQLRERIQMQMAQDEELVIDPAFFASLKGRLPEVSHVEIKIKRGGYYNELTRFRYDVVIHVGATKNSGVIRSWLDCQERPLTLNDVRRILSEEAPDTLGIRGIPSARLAKEIKALELISGEEAPATVGDLQERLRNAPDESIDPEAIWALSRETDYRADITWSGSGVGGCYDVVLHRRPADSSGEVIFDASSFAQDAAALKSMSDYANNPVRRAFVNKLMPKLRSFLQEKLPDYMVPSAFVLLDSLPLTPNGKIDRKALPAPDRARPDMDQDYVAPRSEAEELLVKIWSQVLGVQQVGIHDNFFQLGGDSILSIQVIAKANQAGLNLTPKQLFQYQTIAEIASVSNNAGRTDAEQGLVTGAIPLTPVQRWFFEKKLIAPHHFNQAAMLEAAEEINHAALEEALRRLIDHHDALRLRFTPGYSGWQQINIEREARVYLIRFDLSNLPEHDRAAGMRQVAAELQRSLDLQDGPLMRVALFDLGREIPGRLLIVIHHLAVDGVSWRILLEDLQSAYQQAGRGEAVRLPAKTTSFKQWAEKLSGYALSEAIEQEAEYWLAKATISARPIPVDANGENTEASSETIKISLDEEETRALLQEVPKAYNVQINDVLLSALAQSFHEWTGDNNLRVDLEGHGREDLLEQADITRTVGWFTAIYPVTLEAGDEAEPAETLRRIRRQMMNIPGRGTGYGLARYMAADSVRRMFQQVPQAEVSFNYLGQFDQVLAGPALFKLAGESPGPSRNLKENRAYLIEINGGVAGGRLQFDWAFSRNVHRRDTVEGLAEAFAQFLRAVIADCLSQKSPGFMPSEFPLANLRKGELDAILKNYNVEDIYPLSPTQQGLLFHTLYAPKSVAYFDQWTCTLCDDIDVRAFRRAWQQVIDRHTILRTAFVWEDQDEPRQVVVRGDVELPWEHLDWRKLPVENHQSRLDGFLEADRDRGFDLSKAPVMRCTLIRLEDGLYQFVWSYHHLLLDGWSVPLILKEFFTFYNSRSERRAIEMGPVRPYRDYIGWLSQQDKTRAESYWRKALKGFNSPTPLPMDYTLESGGGQEESHDEQRVSVPATTTSALQSFARQHQITLNTLIQAAWGLLFSCYSNEKDIVFGATVSGRPADLPGVESMVGVFINTLPVRVRVDDEEMLLSWLKRLQAQQAEMRQYDYSPLSQVQSWSEVPRGRRLFDSIVAFENFPIADTSGWQTGLKVKDIRFITRDIYPLTVVIAPGHELSVWVSYDCRRFSALSIATILNHLETVLKAFTENPARRVCDFLLLLESKESSAINSIPETTYENDQFIF
ncbi:MAG: amino acid adenylation domain-containing protein [Blastocatellia bacterium]